MIIQTRIICHDMLIMCVPALSSLCKGYCEELRALFNQTGTVSLMHETLLHTDRVMSGRNRDGYQNSQFGLMDAILNKNLEFKSKREEGSVILARKEDVRLEII